MPRMTDLDRARAIGQIEAGVPQRDVAQMFGVSKSTISKLKSKFQDTGYVEDRPRSGRPKSTTNDEDMFIRLNSLRDRRRSARDVQSMFARRYGRRPSIQTIRNRLHAANLHAGRPTNSYSLSHLQRQARLRWNRLHLIRYQARSIQYCNFSLPTPPPPPPPPPHLLALHTPLLTNHIEYGTLG